MLVLTLPLRYRDLDLLPIESALLYNLYLLRKNVVCKTPGKDMDYILELVDYLFWSCCGIELNDLYVNNDKT